MLIDCRRRGAGDSRARSGQRHAAARWAGRLGQQARQLEKLLAAAPALGPQVESGRMGRQPPLESPRSVPASCSRCPKAKSRLRPRWSSSRSLTVRTGCWGGKVLAFVQCAPRRGLYIRLPDDGRRSGEGRGQGPGCIVMASRAAAPRRFCRAPSARSNIGSFRISAMIMGETEAGELEEKKKKKKKKKNNAWVPAIARVPGFKRGYVTDMEAASFAIPRRGRNARRKARNTSVRSVWIACAGAGLASKCRLGRYRDRRTADRGRGCRGNC